MRNALLRHKDEVRVRSSRIVLSIAETLQNEGYIAGLEVVPGTRTKAQNDLRIRLKYGPAGEQVIRRMARVSRPGRRVYAQVEDLKPVLRGLGIQILSTAKGVLSDRQAREAKVGGEVLCQIE
jgi:small subunit ribosomal protein S8